MVIISSENFRKMGPAARSAFLELLKTMGIFYREIDYFLFMLTLINVGSIQHFQEFDYCQNWQY